jgi:hypothetical protein
MIDSVLSVASDWPRLLVFPTIKGPPETARLISVTYDHCTRCFDLTYEDESFPEVDLFNEIPCANDAAIEYTCLRRDEDGKYAP